MKEFSVNIIGLSKKAHLFEFELKDGFFEKYGKETVSSGQFNAHVVLDKKETFIEVDFNIAGLAHLVCDRSLEPFDHSIDLTKKILFKYGDEAQEVSDEIVIITRDQDSLDLGQYLYEFIALSIPIKKLHPRFREEEIDDESNVKMIYSTSQDVDENNEVDPRWEKLKKLK